MTRLICLHGPESTGKTTLAAPLADYFGTIWVPEYGRAYCRLHGFDLAAADLVAIGREQSAATLAAMAEAKDLLIVDTDALTTAAWSLMILGLVPDGVLDDWPRPDVYLVTDVDIPWEDDGTRYFPADADRARFMAACERVIEETGVRQVRLSGSREERLAQAIAAVEAL